MPKFLKLWNREKIDCLDAWIRTTVHVLKIKMLHFFINFEFTYLDVELIESYYRMIYIMKRYWSCYNLEQSSGKKL